MMQRPTLEYVHKVLLLELCSFNGRYLWMEKRQNCSCIIKTARVFLLVQIQSLIALAMNIFHMLKNTKPIST